MSISVRTRLSAIIRMRKRPTRIVVLLILVYGLARLLNDDGFDPIIDGWLGMLAEGSMATVAWLAFRRATAARPEVGWAAAGITGRVIADCLYLLPTADIEPGSLLFADVCYLLFFPFLLCSLAVRARRQLAAVAFPALLNSAVGAFGAAAVLAVVLQPVIGPAQQPGWTATITVLYPIFDMAIVAVIAGVAAFQNPRAASLVASTVSLAHGLNLRMVAEGVESRAVYDQLTGYGCDRAQGFYMSRPLPAEELDLWITERGTTGFVGEADEALTV